MVVISECIVHLACQRRLIGMTFEWCDAHEARQNEASVRTRHANINKNSIAIFYPKLAQYMCKFKFEYHLGILMHRAAVAAAAAAAVAVHNDTWKYS